MAEMRRRRISVDNTGSHNIHSRTTVSEEDSPVNLALAYLRKKLPAITSLVIGDDASRWSSSFSSTSNWVSPSTFRGSSNAHHRFTPTPPTLDQRFRVFEILATLTGYHTRQCTRFAQKPYRRQVYERYEPLVGYERKRHRKGLSGYLHLPNLGKRGFFGSSYGEEERHEQEFRLSLDFQNVFVSVYENGSTDQTKALLRLFDALARSVGEVFDSVIFMNDVLPCAEGEVFDSVIFMNDVLPCVDDLLELVWQSRRQNAGITCGSDYIFHEEMGQPVFYDNWVARDMNGTALENAPFESVFRDQGSSHRFQRHLPIQVQSCWNGIAVLDSAPIYAHPHVKFRMAKLSEGECSASECSLICNDYWQAGYGRIIMISRVKLAYDKQVYDIIHPERRNLTLVRGYQRLGGHPDDPNSDPQDRSWFGPHDRLFRQEESEELEWQGQPSHVWCWGWDGAGDIEGPDVEPIWEPFPNATMDPLAVRHERSFDFL
ncbi:glycosyltransferase family 69 protein [Atractiella rhizophila]|nr:glycosyltransferase family 69 protein [Atractiella rhizophila]